MGQFYITKISIFWDIMLCSPRLKIAVFEVLTVVVMKNSIFRDIILCRPLKVNQYFIGTCLHYLQGQRISQSEAGSKKRSAGDSKIWSSVPQELEPRMTVLATASRNLAVSCVSLEMHC
jgi:hypothetical protein